MPDTIRVKLEEFNQPLFLNHRVRVTVEGPFRGRGGARFGAKLGNQLLDGVILRPDGTGFTGFVATRPRAGDALVLRRGMFEVDTGVRVGAAASAGLGSAEESVAAVPHARARALGVDCPRGVVRYDAGGATLELASTRSYIFEDAALTPEARAWNPGTREKSGLIRLTVRVPELPAGGRIVWSVPPSNRGSITLSGDPTRLVESHTGAQVDIIGLVPGLSNVDVEARDASGRRLESIKFPLCVPQFVQVLDSGAAFQGVLNALHLGDVRQPVLRAAREVCDHLLAVTNVRTVWSMAPFNEVLPAQFAAGGLAAARVTRATIAGNPPAATPSRFGETTSPAGPVVFNETITLYPGAYAYPVTQGDVEAVDDITRAAATALAAAVNMTPTYKGAAITLIGRLIGETLAHEVVHSLIGRTLAGPDRSHNPEANQSAPDVELGSLMNPGMYRSLTDRTGLRPLGYPVTLTNVVDDGLAAINPLRGAAKAQTDNHFPVPPLFM